MSSIEELGIQLELDDLKDVQGAVQQEIQKYPPLPRVERLYRGALQMEDFLRQLARTATGTLRDYAMSLLATQEDIVGDMEDRFGLSRKEYRTLQL